MRGKSIIFLMAGVLLMISGVARASCFFGDNVSGEVSGYINFGNVMVQRNTPTGSVIATAITGAYNGGSALAGCDEPWTLRWDMMQWRTLSSLGNSIYNTNVPGVGIRLTSVKAGEVLPYVQNRPVNYLVIQGDGIKAELIKTGDINGGTLDTGVLARASVANQFSFANVTLNGNNTITTPSCLVTTPMVDVLMGDHNKSEFKGTGSVTNWVNFSIGLECDMGARINARIDAIPETYAGSFAVMQLDKGGATGAGIQIFDSTTDLAVQFGKTRFYGMSGLGPNTIKLKARYYQTEPTVTSGPANGTATFTVSYK